MVDSQCSDPRNRRNITEGQSNGAKVGYGASILGGCMSAASLQEPFNMENAIAQANEF